PFEAQGYVDAQTPHGFMPFELDVSIREWIEYRPPGNGDMWWENPQAEVIQYTQKAEDRLVGHMSDICQRRKQEDDTHAALWSRSAGKAATLALIFACSRQSPRKGVMVDIDDIDLSIITSNWITRTMIRRTFDHVSDNPRQEK